MIEKIERTIEQLKKTSAWPPWDVSDFVRKA
jgi:hypothetical protein